MKEQRRGTLKHMQFYTTDPPAISSLPQLPSERQAEYGVATKVDKK